MTISSSVAKLCNDIDAIVQNREGVKRVVRRDDLDFVQGQLTTGRGLVKEYLGKRTGKGKQPAEMSSATIHQPDPDEKHDPSYVHAPEDEEEDKEERLPGKGAKRSAVLNHTRLMRFLNQDLGNELRERRTRLPMEKSSAMNEEYSPTPEQAIAGANISAARMSNRKAFIVSDSPGFGKTYMTLLETLQSHKHGDGPVVVVMPSSCTRQWAHETKKFTNGQNILVLDVDSQVDPHQLFKFDFVFTSYSYVRAEYLRLAKYYDQIRAARMANLCCDPIERPKVTLLSGAFLMPGVKRLCHTLVLDETHQIKSTQTKTYKAVFALRNRSDFVLMLTGTPMDHDWTDCLALFKMIRAQPIQSEANLYSAFTDYDCPLHWEDDEEKPQRSDFYPQGKHLDRIVRMFEGVGIRRPKEIMYGQIPAHETELLDLPIRARELRASNNTYKRYQEAQRLVQRKRDGRPMRREDKRVGVEHLVAAQQYALHPRLPGIQALLTKKGDLEGQTAEGHAAIMGWRSNLAQNLAWNSGRVFHIIDQFVAQQDILGDKPCVCIIVAEYRCFLDILEIAFRKVAPSISVWRIDGSCGTGDRHCTIQEFCKAGGSRILLATLGTIGIGLNLQVANLMILCQLFWKVSWVKQAMGRIVRPGQVQETRIVQLWDSKCKIEQHRLTRRNEHFAPIENIVEAMTHHDDEDFPIKTIR